MFLQRGSRSNWKDDHLGVEGARCLDSPIHYGNIPSVTVASTGRLLFSAHVNYFALCLLLIVTVRRYQTNGSLPPTAPAVPGCNM